MAATVVVVSLVSVAAGAGAMLIASHIHTRQEARDLADLARDDAAAEIAGIWTQAMGRLAVLGEALGPAPTNETFGSVATRLQMLEAPVMFVRYDHNGTTWERSSQPLGSTLAITLHRGPAVLTAGVDAMYVQGIVDSYERHLGGRAHLTWHGDAPPGVPADAFGGAVVASLAPTQIWSFEKSTLVQAGGTGVAVASASAIGAFVAAGMVIRPLRRFEADAAALAEGRHPARRGGAKEFVGLSDSMQRAAANIARDKHELHRAQERLGATLRKQTRVVAQQEVRFRRLFEGISHDIKGPLITANVLLQQVRRQAPGEHERLDRALVALHRLRDLVSQLSLLSRAGTEPNTLPFDLSPVIKRAAESVPTTEHPGRTVQWSGPNLVIRSDPDRLRIALAALVDNGVRYGGNVSIRWKQGTMLCIRIEDDGPGFAFEPGMLEPFAVRGDRPGVAAGLGLAIADRLVRSLGGGLQISSDASGTRCSIYLPRDP